MIEQFSFRRLPRSDVELALHRPIRRRVRETPGQLDRFMDDA
jgi:hypothetical protein